MEESHEEDGCAWDADQPWVHFCRIPPEETTEEHQVSLIVLHCVGCGLEITLHLCNVKHSESVQQRLTQAWEWFRKGHLLCLQ